MPDATPHLPLWALYMQVFGTIFAALVAAIIASAIQYRQWKLAQEKFRLDLFDRRARVYSALYAEIMVVNGDASMQKTLIQNALDAMRDYRFLFDGKTVEKLDDARTLLMIIQAECGKVSISHERVMQYFRDFNAVLDVLGPTMISYLRFN